jgi:hypothetical protein
MAKGSQCSEAERAAMRLALRHTEALEPLGTSQDAITLQHGRAFGAVWTGYPIARRVGLAPALGTTRAGKLALWHGSARGIAHGSRLAAVRLAMAPAAGDVLGFDAGDAEALDEHVDGLAGVHAASAERLCAPRSQTTPVNLCLSAVTRRSLAGPHHDLAACGDNRDGHQGTLQIVIA